MTLPCYGCAVASSVSPGDAAVQGFTDGILLLSCSPADAAKHFGELCEAHREAALGTLGRFANRNRFRAEELLQLLVRAVEPQGPRDDEPQQKEAP